MKTSGNSLFKYDDSRWTVAWFFGTGILLVWDLLFLNTPALKQVAAGFGNTFFIAFQVLFYTLVEGWICTLLLHWCEIRLVSSLRIVIIFFLNLLRSIPQIIGVLFGYILITTLIASGIIVSPFALLSIIAFIMSLFICTEMIDLMQERIAYFRKLDFYQAMQVLGVRESRIINFDILWKNSRVHILNKLISILGAAVFLQCSVDFIVSVGLSTDVYAVTLPPTLGGLLAKIDSKQDILAIGYSLTHPGYIKNLAFRHLQGISVAFYLVYSLLCIYRIANGFARRHTL